MMTEVLPRLEQPKSYSFDESKLSTYPRPLLTEEGDHSNGFQPTFTTVLPNIHSEGYTLTSYASYIGDPRKLVVHYVSTPASIRVSLNANTNFNNATSVAPPKINRPRTAAAVLSAKSESSCDRVSQVEHEPTRRHNLENHMPAKRNKPPPWQKNLDTPLVPFFTGPGYILSKSKSKFAVTIKDEFFDPVFDESQKKKHVPTERPSSRQSKDTIIQQLQQQISDLSLYLEEERVNHRQTKQKADEFLKDKIDEMNSQHQDAIRDLEEDHKEDLEKLRLSIEADHQSYKTSAEGQIVKMKKEIEFLQGAFESYKSSLHQDMDDKWNKREDDLMLQLQEDKQAAVHEMKMKVIQERNVERIAMQKDHQKTIENLRKEHKKELDALVRKFSNAAADLERLKKTTKELKETRRELETITTAYNETCQQLANTSRDLADTKVKLLSFEEQFEEKVQQVDTKYQQKINDLITQNVEIRRLFVKKCGQLYEEKVNVELDRVKRVQSAKEVMQSMLRSKQRSDVSFAPGDPDYEEVSHKPKSRSGSAPLTRHEMAKAHSSVGNTEHLLEKEEIPEFPDSIVLEVSKEVEELKKQIMSDIKLPTKEEMLQALASDI
ncbi:flagellum-associated coiled-coil domain-containing protein 1-like isoform X1 [Ostrea edulis]|uniref:flagellum-associated coiled-coil domain-containing protein 1-like isoform X1 n=1 Tax=Ostrea edulis TaxID=37623 RepID=UPI0024AEE74E|nr:flagellum-associated coiled-coil domain-containing protein 1-like isoform X1 [Ostrea edulis]